VPASAAILQFAEEPDYEQPEPWLPGRRLIRPNFTLALSPTPTRSGVSRVRTTADDLDATIAEVRAFLREHGYVACAWYIGPSCRPVGIAKLLAERGFVPATGPALEPHYTAMVLTGPPPAGPPTPGVEARVVHTCDEYVRAFRAGLTSIGESEEAIAKWIEAAPAGWEHENGIAKMTHIAFADGNVAGVGMVSYGASAVLLGGGAVLPAFRGRGVYRALVASRWRAAVEMGKPALTVHAGAMSRPILERCGFEVVCQVDLLMDPTLG
jgi:GNAT superfamily N-acetyltransferase